MSEHVVTAMIEADVDAESARREALRPFVDALESAAIELRDSELALKQAQADYRRALDAFNRHVAPIPQ